jgi:hypothetical protein
VCTPLFLAADLRFLQTHCERVTALAPQGNRGSTRPRGPCRIPNGSLHSRTLRLLENAPDARMFLKRSTRPHAGWSLARIAERNPGVVVPGF